jgi:hypothetical protein
VDSPAAASGIEQKYWANLPPKQLVGELQAHERAWWAEGERRGLWQLLRLSYAQAQGMDPGGSVNQTQQLQFCGPRAEFVRFRIQLTRSHVKQRNIMAMGQRPSFQCLALNDSFESQAQIPTAQAALDGVYRACRGEKIEWEALDSDGYFGEGGVWGRWDFDGGREITVNEQEPANDQFTGEPITDPQTGQPVMRTVSTKKKSGAPTLTSLFPWEIVREPLARGEPAWLMVREVCSKWELAARFPEHYDAIVAIDNIRSEAGIAEMFAYNATSATTDQIIVRHFYHRNSVAVPGGRYVGVAGDIPLWDLPCPIPEGLPVNLICTGRYFGTAFGYPECTDLLAIQEMLDELFSQAANNLLRLGNQSLFAEDGVEVDPRKLSEGGGFFTIPRGARTPEAVQWAKLPPEFLAVVQSLTEYMNFISGMNATARGAPEANISSGTFAALMLNIAQKFVTATEMSLDALRNANGNLLLHLIRANCEQEFVAQVAGPNQLPYLRTFKPSDVSGIELVQVTQRSPLMEQIPARFEVYDRLSKIPDKRDRAAAYQLMETGNPDAYTQADRASSLLIQWENEQLSKGIAVMPAVTDDPDEHNKSHKAEYDKLRTNPDTPPEVLMAFQEHMSQQALVHYGGDPALHMTVGVRPSPLFVGISAPTSDAAGGGAPAVPPIPGAQQAGTPLPDEAEQPETVEQPTTSVAA